MNTYVPLMFHAKLQPNIPSGSGEEVDFVIFAFSVTATCWIFNLTQFYNSENLESGHVPCEILYSCFIEDVSIIYFQLLMDEE